jgi:hypothetical protein
VSREWWNASETSWRSWWGKGNPVTIKKTIFGYSMYATEDMTESPYDGLIASCNKLADQIDFAARMGWPYIFEGI